MNLKRFAALVVVAALAIGAPLTVHAEFVALTSPDITGSQNWNGALGMDFDVLSPIVVTRLGAFDSGADGIASQLGIRVGIFDRNTQSLVGSSATVTTSSPLVGSDRFVDVADFILGVGNYSIVAVGFDSTDRNGNNGFGDAVPAENNGGGSISFVGSSRFSLAANSFEYPTTIDGGPANRYDAGTFEFKQQVLDAQAPEPATVALLGFGVAGIGFSRRRKI